MAFFGPTQKYLLPCFLRPIQEGCSHSEIVLLPSCKLFPFSPVAHLYILQNGHLFTATISRARKANQLEIMGCSCCGRPPPTLLPDDSPSALEAHGHCTRDCCLQSPNEDAGAAPVEAASADAGINMLDAGSDDDAQSGGGCCGVNEPPSDDRRNGSCGNETAAATGDSTTSADAHCQKDFATANQDKDDSTICTDGCYNDGCSGTKPPETPTTTDIAGRPACCRSKPPPCCDEACLDLLALRECADKSCVDENGDGT